MRFWLGSYIYKLILLMNVDNCAWKLVAQAICVSTFSSAGWLARSGKCHQGPCTQVNHPEKFNKEQYTFPVVIICKAMQSTLHVWEAEHLQILFLGWVGCGHETNPICVDNNTHSDILLMPTCTQQILIKNGSTHTKTSPSSLLE